MDFNKEHMEKFGYGIYEPLEIPDDLPIYIAYRTDLAEGSEILHSRLALDYEAGVPEVHAAVREWADLTDTSPRTNTISCLRCSTEILISDARSAVRL